MSFCTTSLTDIPLPKFPGPCVNVPDLLQAVGDDHIYAIKDYRQKNDDVLNVSCVVILGTVEDSKFVYGDETPDFRGPARISERK